MISALVYDVGRVEHYSVEDEADLEAAREATGTTWIRVSSPTEAEVRAVSEAFSLHPLEVEDVRSGVRPKTEELDEHTFVLVKTVALERGETTFEEEIRTQPIGLFLGEDWLVTMTDEDDHVPVVSDVWQSVENQQGRVLKQGPDFAAYRVIDHAVEEYFDLLDNVGDTIETIEESILSSPDSELIEELNAVRRDLLSFRKVVWPMREAVGTLARGDLVGVRETTEKYYRDVYDHLVEIVDLTETYRDLTRGTRDIYLNVVSQSTNEVMKRLTVVATIFIPLTFVVGVYGMNFGEHATNMPELTWPYAYPAVILGMTLVTTVLLVYFRREGWM
ncbi:magnesium/cobalt transporter CorA [Halobellus rufus]|uniref:magnesium/cobalt transporter CorA n=1 Tax=Halobellus rufus TaxID=1448860 RepID=UPI0006787300|nr:magnesium/cobalt transporter CorA [Halobellus rufus]